MTMPDVIYATIENFISPYASAKVWTEFDYKDGGAKYYSQSKVDELQKEIDRLNSIEASSPEGPLIVSRKECSENAWKLLGLRAEAYKILSAENLKLQKHLCLYKGHLPISDGQGNTYCELCQEQIGDSDE